MTISTKGLDSGEGKGSILRLSARSIKELDFVDTIINPDPGEGERGTNLGGSSPNGG